MKSSYVLVWISMLFIMKSAAQTEPSDVPPIVLADQPTSVLPATTTVSNNVAPSHIYFLLAVDNLSIDILQTKSESIRTTVAAYIAYNLESISLYHVVTDQAGPSNDGKLGLTIRATVPAAFGNSTTPEFQNEQARLRDLLMPKDATAPTIASQFTAAKIFESTNYPRVLSVDSVAPISASNPVSASNGQATKPYITASLTFSNAEVSDVDAFQSYRIAFAIANLIVISPNNVTVYDAEKLNDMVGTSRVLVTVDIDLDTNSMIPVGDQRETYDEYLLNGRMMPMTPLASPQFSSPDGVVLTLDMALVQAGVGTTDTLIFDTVTVNMYPGTQTPGAEFSSTGNVQVGINAADAGLYQGRRKIPFTFANDTSGLTEGVYKGCPFSYCTHFVWDAIFDDGTTVYLDAIETKQDFFTDSFSAVGGDAPVIGHGNVSMWTIAPVDGRKLDIIFNIKRTGHSAYLSVRAITSLDSVSSESCSLTAISFDGKIATEYYSSLINGKEMSLYIKIRDVDIPDVGGTF